MAYIFLPQAATARFSLAVGMGAFVDQVLVAGLNISTVL